MCKEHNLSQRRDTQMIPRKLQGHLLQMSRVLLGRQGVLCVHRPSGGRFGDTSCVVFVLCLCFVFFLTWYLLLIFILFFLTFRVLGFV